MPDTINSSNELEAGAACVQNDARQGGLTRRNFLKTTGLVAGAVAVVSGTKTLTALGEEEKGEASSEEKVYRCICRPSCWGTCKLGVHVRDGKAVKISRMEYNDPAYSRSCLRGFSNIQRIYDANRLKYPLRRVEGTARGTNEFERISWEEAITEITDKWKEIQKEYGEEAVSSWYGSGCRGAIHGRGWMTRLTNCMNTTSINNAVDSAIIHGQNRVMGKSKYGSYMCNEATDLVNAKTIFIWGHNPVNATPQEWHFIKEACQGGSKLVVIDPLFTVPAAKADLWVSIQPGTDTALELAMMNVVLEEGKQDENFLKTYTVAPFLVRDDNGKFLRTTDLASADQGSDTAGSVLVWDSAIDSFTSIDNAIDPVLTGKREINGITCRTAFDLLKEEIDKYSPEDASKICKVDPDTIRELAHLHINGPVTHRHGLGSQAWANGVHVIHAGLTLCALTGNLGKPGAGCGSCSLSDPGTNSAARVPSVGKSSSSSVTIIQQLPTIMTKGEWQGKKKTIKSIIIFCANYVNTGVDINAMKRDVFDHMDLIVTMDTTMTDTALYSDYVLPVCHWFECEDVITDGCVHRALHSEKALEPLYESKSDGDIAKLFAEKMGFANEFTWSDEDHIREWLKSDYHEQYGISYETLKEKGDIRYLPEPFIAWEDLKFATPSGRIEFYLESPSVRVNYGQDATEELKRDRLPRYFHPMEAYDENPLKEKYPLICMPKRLLTLVHSQFWTIPVLREIDKEPTVLINPSDAEARDIVNGDYVEAYNDRGHAVAKAFVTEATRPGMIVYTKSWQSTQHKAGHWSELTSGEVDPVGANYNFSDVLCEIRYWGKGE